MYNDRRKIMKELEELLDTKIMLYVTSDRPNFSTQIAHDAIDLFVHHLDNFSQEATDKSLTLLLYSRGGATMAAWRLVNMIRQFFDKFNVIVFSKAHSAATIISIGADKIIMTKQATLGPIDPSVNTPLNPPIPGAPPNNRLPVSVEAIKGYIELSKDEFGIVNEEGMIRVLEELSRKVHPLVLGEVYRARTQIQMIARKLLVNQVEHDEDVDKIIDFLTSDSGSHDYTIHRREAKESLGLTVEKPSEEMYNLIKALHDDFYEELGISKSFNPVKILNGANSNPVDESAKCGLIESVESGSHYYQKTTRIMKNQKNQISVNNVEGGWFYESK